MSIVTVQSWENDPKKAYRLIQFALLCLVLACEPKDLINGFPTASPLSSNPLQLLEEIRRQLHELKISTSKIPTVTTRIAELREQRGLTQKQLAEIIDVSITTVQNWENNRTSAGQFVQLFALCTILECSAEALVDYIPEKDCKKLAELGNISEAARPQIKDINQIRTQIKSNISEVCQSQDQTSSSLGEVAE